MKRAVIVGGGIAGLAAAYYLRALSQRKGVQLEVVLLEKEQRAGGCILTERAEGFVVEGGPDCLYAEKPWGLELCREIGLGDQLVEARPETRGTYILWDGQLHPLPEGFFLLVPTALSPFLRSRLLSWRAKLRVALEPLVPRRRGQGDESLASFVLRRLGREVLEKVAEPLVAGIHAAEPETMSLRATFPRFADLESRYGSLLLGLWKVRRKASPANRPYKVPFVSLRGGMGEMVEGILEHLPPESVRLGEEVL
ncbi:MAG: protoporphyrinogen oxidase, partial [Deltaproteobacteria bacterium]